jgi:hypothetical protein
LLLERRMIGRRLRGQRQRVREHSRFDGRLGRRHHDGGLPQSLRQFREPRARRRRGQCPQKDFAGARHTHGRAEAGLVVFVGDLEAAPVLLLVRVLAEAIVIEAQVHGRGVRRPHPQCNGGRVAIAAANVELRGMALPEIADAEGDAAAGAAEIGEAAGAAATAAVQPGVSIRRALADGEGVGVRLEQRPVAEGGDVLQPLANYRRQHAGRTALDLRIARRLARIAAQPGEAAHGLAEHAAFLAHESHVAVVQFVLDGRCESQSDTADEVLVLVAVEHDGMQHPQRVTAGVEIQPQGERQPGAAGVDVSPFDLHHRAHRTALLERHLVDGTAEVLLRDRHGVAASRAILADQHQPPIAQRLAAIARQ